MNKRLAVFVAMALLAIVIAAPASSQSSPSSSRSNKSVPLTQGPGGDSHIAELVLQAVSKHDDVLAFLINDVRVTSIDLSRDGNWAVAELEFVDKESGEALATEPGLALARKTARGWRVVIQADAEWANWFGFGAGTVDVDQGQGVLDS